MDTFKPMASEADWTSEQSMVVAVHGGKAKDRPGGGGRGAAIPNGTAIYTNAIITCPLCQFIKLLTNIICAPTLCPAVCLVGSFVERHYK